MITMSDKVKLPGNVRDEFISEADPDWEKKASPEMKRVIEAAQRGAKYDTPEKAEDALSKAGLVKEFSARYKIELSFGAGRTVSGPNLVGIQLWESGRKLNGGGDELMYYCQHMSPDRHDGCWGAIPGENIGYNKVTGKEIAVCPKCFKQWTPKDLTTMRVFRLPTRKLAEITEKLFRQLDSNADFYCKYHPTDIRYQAMLKAKGLATARKLKGMHMYRLHRVISDLSVGASLQNRLVAFLSS